MDRSVLMRYLRGEPVTAEEMKLERTCSVCGSSCDEAGLFSHNNGQWAYYCDWMCLIAATTKVGEA